MLLLNVERYIDSFTKNIKVFKISCVKQLDKEGNKYSKSDFYWLNKDNGYVYDLKDKYLIGQLKIENNHFVKKDNNFIIDHLVPY